MLELPSVTLVCADTLNHELAARALARCCERVRFGRALFLTDRAPSAAVPGVEVRRIAPLDSRDAYSELMVKGLAAHVETAHALVVQWDGYVVNPGAWSDEFLAFDYIGAPWFWAPEGARVGNGGFSLRSRRLLEALADPAIVVEGNEDVTICTTHRSLLETRHAIRFAPEDLAARFSFEASYPIGRPFGFHGLFNFARVETDATIASLAPAFPDAIARSPQMHSLMRNCVAMGQSQAAFALATRIAAADPGNEEARRVLADAEQALARGPVVGRNEPCPCGSGRRYKACHGAIGGAGAPVPTAAKDPDTLTREGIEAHRSGRIDEAKRCYESALAAAPDHPYAGHYLAVIAMQRRDYATAIPRLERAALARPDEPDFHSNLGLAYAAVDRIDDAIAAHRRSLALHPENASAWNNLGLALVEQCRHAEAVDAYRRALGIDPAFPKGRWNLAMARLMLGDRGGWADYEARLRIDELGHPPDIPGIARWHGGDVGGRTLILDAEQGYGDMLQFIRYAKVLAGRGARVIVRARDPVADLVRTAPGVSEVVPIEAIPRADAWLPLMSLPGILGIDPHGEPPDPPYLFADPSRTEAIRARLAQRRARLHVGLSWAGNPVQQNNRRRSIPLAVLAPLLERDDVAWYSLQRIDGEDEIASVPAARALVLPDERNEFMGKAALMGALDLVVSVCTSNAHLAGALARPTWIALAFAPDWRWGTAGASTRWYPTARLFRQPAPGDWTSVVRDIGLALDRRLAEA